MNVGMIHMYSRVPNKSAGWKFPPHVHIVKFINVCYFFFYCMKISIQWDFLLKINKRACYLVHESTPVFGLFLLTLFCFIDFCNSSKNKSPFTVVEFLSSLFRHRQFYEIFRKHSFATLESYSFTI